MLARALLYSVINAAARGPGVSAVGFSGGGEGEGGAWSCWFGGGCMGSVVTLSVDIFSGFDVIALVMGGVAICGEDVVKREKDVEVCLHGCGFLASGRRDGPVEPRGREPSWGNAGYVKAELLISSERQHYFIETCSIV